MVLTVEKRLKRSNVQNGENGSNTENGLEVKRDQEPTKAQKAKHLFLLDFVTIQRHLSLPTSLTKARSAAEQAIIAAKARSTNLIHCKNRKQP